MIFNHPPTLRAQNRKEIYYNHYKPAFYKERGSTLRTRSRTLTNTIGIQGK